jgi:hypothetical protein
MPHLSRFCDGCHEERLFEQFHADPAVCPDTTDGECREWGCTECGAALIIGLPVLEPVASRGASRAA